MEAHSVQPQHLPICPMHQTSPTSSFGLSKVKGSNVNYVRTWIHGGSDVEGTSGSCKHESHQTMSVSSVCMSCLRQTCFQTELSRSCSTTQVTGNGIPSEWRLGSQPLPDWAERPICPTCLAFTRPSVAPAVAFGSLGAARSASRSGNPIQRLRRDPLRVSLLGRAVARPGLNARPHSGRYAPFVPNGVARARSAAGGGSAPTSPSFRRASLAQLWVVGAWAHLPAGGSPCPQSVALGRHAPFGGCCKTLAFGIA